jgi:hypothetical protein
VQGLHLASDSGSLSFADQTKSFEISNAAAFIACRRFQKRSPSSTYALLAPLTADIGGWYSVACRGSTN